MILVASAILVLAVPLYYAAWSLHKFIFLDHSNPHCAVCNHVTASYEMISGQAVCISCSHREAN